MCGWNYLVSFFFCLFGFDGFLVLMRLFIFYLSVMSFVGYDYRKERKGVDDDDDGDDDGPLENFDDENDNNT